MEKYGGGASRLRAHCQTYMVKELDRQMNQMDAKHLMNIIRGALEDFDATASLAEILTGDIQSSVADGAVMTITVDGKEYEITIRGDD